MWLSSSFDGYLVYKSRRRRIVLYREIQGNSYFTIDRFAWHVYSLLLLVFFFLYRRWEYSQHSTTLLLLINTRDSILSQVQQLSSKPQRTQWQVFSIFMSGRRPCGHNTITRRITRNSAFVISLWKWQTELCVHYSSQGQTDTEFSVLGCDLSELVAESLAVVNFKSPYLKLKVMEYEEPTTVPIQHLLRRKHFYSSFISGSK